MKTSCICESRSWSQLGAETVCPLSIVTQHIITSNTCIYGVTWPVSVYMLVFSLSSSPHGKLLRQFNAWLLTQVWGVWIALIGNPPNRLIIYYEVMWTNYCFSGRVSVYLNKNRNNFHEVAHNFLVLCIYMEFYVFVKRKPWAFSQRFN